MWTDVEDYACFENTFGGGMGEEQEKGSGEVIAHIPRTSTTSSTLCI